MFLTLSLQSFFFGVSAGLSLPRSGFSARGENPRVTFYRMTRMVAQALRLRLCPYSTSVVVLHFLQNSGKLIRTVSDRMTTCVRPPQAGQMALPSCTVSGTQASVRVNDFTPLRDIGSGSVYQTTKTASNFEPKKETCRRNGAGFRFFCLFFRAKRRRYRTLCAEIVVKLIAMFRNQPIFCAVTSSSFPHSHSRMRLD